MAAKPKEANKTVRGKKHRCRDWFAKRRDESFMVGNSKSPGVA